MKKIKMTDEEYKYPHVTKLWRVMKITCLLLMIFLVQVSASTYSQSAKLTLNLKNVTLSELFSEIEKTTEFRFFYDNSELDLSKRKTLNVEDSKIEEVLDNLFKESDISYEILDRYIIIKTKEEAVRRGSKIVGDALQQRAISGKVTDTRNLPLPGVTVVVKGTTQGTVTNADGSYSIVNVASGGTLQFSFVGMKTQEVVIGSQTSINVVMEEETIGIEEVVAIGYGTVKKRDLTGSVTSVSNEVITEQNASNAVVALRGQIAGLSVQQNNGRAGGEQTVILRGQSAIGKTVSPLVIIDGMPSSYRVFSDMDPGDIERVDVLKDASSTAIYGSRASGGVIIVTTKTGREQKNVVSYRGTVGVTKLTNNPEMMNTQQFYQFYQDGVAFRGEPQDNKVMADDLDYIQQGINTNWLDFILRDGFETRHNISLSGGGKNETHYMSLGYHKEEGIQKSEAYERFSLNARVTGKVLDKLTAGASLYTSYAVNDRGDQNMLNSAYRLRPWGNPYNEDGSYRFFPTQNESAFVNPIFDLQNSKWEQKRVMVRGMAYLEYEPLNGLLVKSSFMPNFSMNRTGNYIGEWTRQNVGKAGSSKSDATNNWGIGYLWENTFNYTKKIGTDHSLVFTGLFSMEDGNSEEYKGLVQGLTYPDEYWYNMGASTSINSLTSSFSETSMISYMGRVNYNFKEKYLLTLTGRWDGSSKFATSHKWGFFPSAALAWRAGEEDFIKDLKMFSNLKVRLSYGVAGNNAVNPYSSFATLSTTIYAWDESSAKGSAAKMANQGLGWEKSFEYNLGIDLGFFDERLTGIIDLYHKTTKDLILSRQIPSHQGVTSLSQNVGSVRNKGIEVTLNSINFRSRQFTWQTSLNFATNKNEILELYGDKTNDKGNKLFIGQPVTVSYDYKFIGIWQLGEEEEALKYGAKPGYVKIQDVDGDKKITPEKDMQVLGNPFPKWTAGITNTFDYLNFDLSFFVYTRQGEFVKSAFHNDLATTFDTRYNIPTVSYWTPTNPSNRWIAAGAPNTNFDKASYMATSFWRVGHITLGYTFKQNGIKKVGFSDLRTYLQVTNPFVFTRYDGWDPEYPTQGTGAAPLNGVTYNIGLNVSF